MTYSACRTLSDTQFSNCVEIYNFTDVVTIILYFRKLMMRTLRCSSCETWTGLCVMCRPQPTCSMYFVARCCCPSGNRYEQQSVAFPHFTYYNPLVFCALVNLGKYSILFIRYSAYLCVSNKNFNLGTIFWCIDGRTFILGMHVFMTNP